MLLSRLIRMISRGFFRATTDDKASITLRFRFHFGHSTFHFALPLPRLIRDAAAAASLRFESRALHGHCWGFDTCASAYYDKRTTTGLKIPVAGLLISIFLYCARVYSRLPAASLCIYTGAIRQHCLRRRLILTGRPCTARREVPMLSRGYVMTGGFLARARSGAMPIGYILFLILRLKAGRVIGERRYAVSRAEAF